MPQNISARQTYRGILDPRDEAIRHAGIHLSRMRGIDRTGNLSITGKLNEIINAIGSEVATIVISDGTYRLSTSPLTIPANVTLSPRHGGVLSLDSGVTITHAGSVGDTRHQWISGLGTITFTGGNVEVWGDWYGATGGSDDTVALQAWLDTITASNVEGLLSGKTYTVTGLSKSTFTSIRIRGENNTVLKLKDSSGSIILDLDTASQITVENIAFDGNRANQSAGAWHGLNVDTCLDVTVRVCRAYSNYQHGIKLFRCRKILTIDNECYDNGTSNIRAGDGINVQSCAGIIAKNLSHDNGLNEVQTSTYEWIQSTVVTEAWYLRLVAGSADHGFSSPNTVIWVDDDMYLKKTAALLGAITTSQSTVITDLDAGNNTAQVRASFLADLSITIETTGVVAVLTSGSEWTLTNPSTTQATRTTTYHIKLEAGNLNVYPFIELGKYWSASDLDSIGHSSPVYIFPLPGVNPNTGHTSIKLSFDGDGIQIQQRHTMLSLSDSTPTYKWTVSTIYTFAYYMELNAGGNPSVAEPININAEATMFTRVQDPSAMKAQEWAYGDFQSLGYDTVWVRMTGDTDPDAETNDTVQAELVATGTDVANFWTERIDGKGITLSGNTTYRNASRGLKCQASNTSWVGNISTRDNRALMMTGADNLENVHISGNTFGDKRTRCYEIIEIDTDSGNGNINRRRNLFFADNNLICDEIANFAIDIDGLIDSHFDIRGAKIRKALSQRFKLRTRNQSVNAFTDFPKIASDNQWAIDGGTPAAVIVNETTIDTVLVRSTGKISFNDTDTYISSPTDGDLDIVADSDIRIRGATSVVLDKDGTLTNIRSATYQWTLSGSDVYYLEDSGGGAPTGISQPIRLFGNSIIFQKITPTVAGDFLTSQWSWSDLDTLGFSTVYVKLLDSTDPDSKGLAFVEAQLADAGEIQIDLAGNVWINKGFTDSRVGIGTPNNATVPATALHVIGILDVELTIESVDARTGIVFKDPDGETRIVSVGREIEIRAGLEIVPAGDPVKIEGSSDRYRLEWIAGARGKPGLNADIQNAAEATRMVTDPNFEIQGGNSVSANVTYDVDGGITLTTAGGDGDEMILVPHADTDQSAWTQTNWGTRDTLRWECNIETGSSIGDAIIWAGVKLTSTEVTITDADQAFFRYENGVNDGEWEAIDSISGSDTVTDTNIVVGATTRFHLVISITSGGVATFYINGTLVKTSLALTNVNLIPFIGVAADGAAAAKALNIRNQVISRS